MRAEPQLRSIEPLWLVNLRVAAGVAAPSALQHALAQRAVPAAAPTAVRAPAAMSAPPPPAKRSAAEAGLDDATAATEGPVIAPTNGAAAAR